MLRTSLLFSCVLIVVVLQGCGGSKCVGGTTSGVGRGGTPIGEAERVRSTCGTDCECICLEFPKSHAGRRCACGPGRR